MRSTHQVGVVECVAGLAAGLCADNAGVGEGMEEGEGGGGGVEEAVSAAQDCGSRVRQTQREAEAGGEVVPVRVEGLGGGQDRIGQLRRRELLVVVSQAEVEGEG